MCFFMFVLFVFRFGFACSVCSLFFLPAVGFFLRFLLHFVSGMLCFFERFLLFLLAFDLDDDF